MNTDGSENASEKTPEEMLQRKSFRGVTLCAAVLSVLCAALGILVSILAGTPVGSTIVAIHMGVFLIFYLFAGIQRKVR